MKLQRLHLDLARPTRRRPPAGLVALALGVVALAGSLAWLDASARRLAEAQGELDRQLERVGQRKVRASGPARPADAREQRGERALRAMQADLALPWDRLLGALETVQRPDVALLVVEPNAADRRVRLQLEARHVDAMLAYLDALQADARLDGVMLQTQQAAGEAHPGAVRFQVVARWGAAR